MNTEWIKTATNEELLVELENTLQHLNNTQVFTPEYRNIHSTVKLIKEEILNRMNR